MADPASDYSTAWEQFQQVRSIKLLQETQEWEWVRGRTDFVAFLIAIGSTEVREYIASKAARIAHIPGVEVYPERYWHITVKGVGFLCDVPTREDEVSYDDVRRLSEEARPIIEERPQFEVRFGRPNAFPEVAFLETEDGGAVRDLNQRLLAGMADLKRFHVDGEVFLPHISIARFNSSEGLSELKETLEEMREESAGSSFTVREVLLIQARLSEEAPTFDLLARYSLRAN